MFFAHLLLCKVQTQLCLFTYFVRSQSASQDFPLDASTKRLWHEQTEHSWIPCYRKDEMLFLSRG